MTPPIVQRLRDAAAALGSERVSMQAMAQAHGPEAQGTMLLLMAVPCLLPVPFGNVLPALALVLIGLGLVFRDGMAMLLGGVMAGLAMCFTTGLLLMAWLWGAAFLPGWMVG